MSISSSKSDETSPEMIKEATTQEQPLLDLAFQLAMFLLKMTYTTKLTNVCRRLLKIKINVGQNFLKSMWQPCGSGPL